MADDIDFLDVVEAELSRVEETLVRLDDGTYGTCGSCGSPIGEARLVLDPMASLCVDCDRSPGTVPGNPAATVSPYLR